MKNAKSWLIPVVIVLAAALLLMFVGGGDGPPFVSNSRGNMGAGVLYDTLQRLGFNVGRSVRPLTTRTDIFDTYIIIEPRSPWISEEMAKNILEWVYAGGRLIYLQNNRFLFEQLLGGGSRYVYGFSLFAHGRGEVLTGSSYPITNRNLADNSAGGHGIFVTLTGWNVERVRFADYYHGFHAETTLVGNLPLVVQLFLIQSAIFAAALIWHLGKRFGAVVPYYRIIEREENEYLRSLARLYYLTRNRGGKNRA